MIAKVQFICSLVIMQLAQEHDGNGSIRSLIPQLAQEHDSKGSIHLLISHYATSTRT